MKYIEYEVLNKEKEKTKYIDEVLRTRYHGVVLRMVCLEQAAFGPLLRFCVS